MLNERLDTIHAAQREIVHVWFDLSDEQLFAVAHAIEAIIDERYRGTGLDADAVLDLRGLVAIHDNALERAQDGFYGGTLSMSVSRLGLVARVLREWLARCERVGFIRAQDAMRAPVTEALLAEVAELHARALRVALGLPEPLIV